MVSFDSRSDCVADQVVFTLDLAGNFKSVNRAGELLTGYSREQLCRLNVQELLPETSASQLNQYVRRAIRRRFGAVFEIEVSTRRGKPTRVEVSVGLITRVGGAREFQCIAIPLENRGRAAPSRPHCLDAQFRDAGKIASLRRVR